jgi:hypothetical protein
MPSQLYSRTAPDPKIALFLFLRNQINATINDMVIRTTVPDPEGRLGVLHFLLQNCQGVANGISRQRNLVVQPATYTPRHRATYAPFRQPATYAPPRSGPVTPPRRGLYKIRIIPNPKSVPTITPGPGSTPPEKVSAGATAATGGASHDSLSWYDRCSYLSDQDKDRQLTSLDSSFATPQPATVPAQALKTSNCLQLLRDGYEAESSFSSSASSTSSSSSSSSSTSSAFVGAEFVNPVQIRDSTPRLAGLWGNTMWTDGSEFEDPATRKHAGILSHENPYGVLALEDTCTSTTTSTTATTTTTTSTTTTITSTPTTTPTPTTTTNTSTATTNIPNTTTTPATTGTTTTTTTVTIINTLLLLRRRFYY